MSLYQMMNGVNPATFVLLPMLGKHPDEYPRFRDCWAEPCEWVLREDGLPVIKSSNIEQQDDAIFVYTRVGGGNRESYEIDIEELQAMPEYIRDYDDPFDSTYATFVFAIPEKWKPAYEAMKASKPLPVEYVEQMQKVFPKLHKEFESLKAVKA